MDYKDLSGRAWLLLLFSALGEAGLLPVPKMRLHRVLYLSNCLAPVFESKAPVDRVVKYFRGPFYPDAQWDIDRLMAGNLLILTEIQYGLVDERGSWIDARYDLAADGKRVTHDLLSLPSLRRIYGFLVELANAFSSLADDRLDNTALKDVNYTAPAKARGALISFDSPQVNYSVQTAELFRHLAPVTPIANRREQLFLYVRYLDRRNLVAG
ncbi:MAG TPA: hypothetical protein VGW57_15430 [Chthoniobacterales bacterium]|nr:hypothetical protein [Chthoniobacterales bacterium]